MAMGGIPQYLKQVCRGESASQAIDKLFFEKQGILKVEFTNLYRSLFDNATHHEAIVRSLAKKNSGLSRIEIIEACGFTTGGGTTRLFGIKSNFWGIGILGIDFSESEQEEVNITNASGRSPEGFDFGVERFRRSIGASVIKVVEDTLVVSFDRPVDGPERFDPGLLYFIEP